MFALINTMESFESIIGRVLSRHKIIEKAEYMDIVFQRQVRKSNGQNSYIPTRIVELKSNRIYRGSLINKDDIF